MCNAAYMGSPAWYEGFSSHAAPRGNGSPPRLGAASDSMREASAVMPGHDVHPDVALEKHHVEPEAVQRDTDVVKKRSRWGSKRSTKDVAL